MKYRKKPVVIEAFMWTGGPEQEEDPAWIIEAIQQGLVAFRDSGTHKVKLLIKTLEGVMVADQGDYIIKGIEGEIYPCKANIFKQTYEGLGND